jgi:hypothetical protein
MFLALMTMSLMIFIERRAQMDVAVGVRRAVVQDIRRAAFGRRPDFAVNIHFFPFFKHLRLALGQIGFHRKSVWEDSTSVCNPWCCSCLFFSKK